MGDPQPMCHRASGALDPTSQGWCQLTDSVDQATAGSLRAGSEFLGYCWDGRSAGGWGAHRTLPEAGAVLGCARLVSHTLASRGQLMARRMDHGVLV